MKRFFSSFMIFSCVSFYTLLGMELSPATKSGGKHKTQKTINTFADLQKNLEEEGSFRNSTSKEANIKRQIHKRMRLTRPYLANLVDLKDSNTSAISNLLSSYKLFDSFIANQLALPHGYTQEQHLKDNIILMGMYNALSSLFKMDDTHSQDLSQSTICINNFQSSAGSFDTLKKKKSDLEKQRKCIDEQLVLVDNQLEFESLRQDFTRAQLQKQQALKVEQAKIEQTEEKILEQEIAQLTQELQAKRKQAAATQSKQNQIHTLLVEDFLKV